MRDCCVERFFVFFDWKISIDYIWSTVAAVAEVAGAAAAAVLDVVSLTIRLILTRGRNDTIATALIRFKDWKRKIFVFLFHLI